MQLFFGKNVLLAVGAYSPDHEACTDLHSAGLCHCSDRLSWPREPRNVTIPYTEKALCGAAGQPVVSWWPLKAADAVRLDGCAHQRCRSPRVEVMDASENRAAVRLWKLSFPFIRALHIVTNCDAVFIPATFPFMMWLSCPGLELLFKGVHRVQSRRMILKFFITFILCRIYWQHNDILTCWVTAVSRKELWPQTGVMADVSYSSRALHPTTKESKRDRENHKPSPCWFN